VSKTKAKVMAFEEKLKGYYVCVAPWGADYTSVSCLRNYAIKKRLQGSNMSWKEAKKHGWKCIKVDIVFTEVSK
jgi:hypothetical protein